MANLVSRRLLKTITKITSKRNFPEIITFRYANKDDEDDDDQQSMQSNKSKNKSKAKAPIDCDKVYLSDAGGATKNIKILIMKALNMLDDESNEPPKN